MIQSALSKPLSEKKGKDITGPKENQMEKLILKII
jgi:hypothetical protein